MTLRSTVLQRLDDRLSLAGLDWAFPHGHSGRREAAVLVALTSEEEPRVLLGRRALHLSLHPGEVAFPGGKREAEDDSPWVTARREALEEVGIPVDVSRPLGELQPLVTRTGFEVHACVAALAEEPQLRVDHGEFDSVFWLPLRTFADPALFRLETMSDGERSRKVPHYQVVEDNIWGVTAAVLAQLANLAYDAGLDLQRNWKESP